MTLARASTVLLGVAGVAALLAACGKVETAAVDDAGVADSAASDAATARSACSTGPAHEQPTELPIRNEVIPRDTPQCLPRCDYSGGRYQEQVFIEAVPSGACTVEGETCEMAAWDRCPSSCPEPNGALNAYLCRCEGGEWACINAGQGGGGCFDCGPPVDGGADADGG